MPGHAREPALKLPSLLSLVTIIFDIDFLAELRRRHRPMLVIGQCRFLLEPALVKAIAKIADHDDTIAERKRARSGSSFRTRLARTGSA